MILHGKVALVTGGGRGIARGIALALAQAGADVAVAGIDPVSSAPQQYREATRSGFPAVEQTVAELCALGGCGVALRADVTAWNDVRAMVDATLQQLGSLDILVCDAGPVHVSWVDHFRALSRCYLAAFGALKQRPGASIINVASVAGKNGAPGMAHYCASKFAVVGFTNSLAKELARHGIRANAICPGILRTQMWEYLTEEFRAADEDREAAWQRYVRTLIPLGRAQTPEDIGQLAVYLASAPNVTGQAINVDGGMELH